MPAIAFRVDASFQIGSGHVMRCLALANFLKDKGGQCTFICRPHSGHMIDFISNHGHAILVLPELKSQVFIRDATTIYEQWLGVGWEEDALDTQYLMAGRMFDWIVVDHYSLDIRWEKTLRSNALRILSIDDLANRYHDCDLLLDQNLGRKIFDYAGLISPYSVVLIGPQYALLRPEFGKLRPYSLMQRVSPRFKKLLIAMGGVDKDNATGRVLDVLNLCSLPEDLIITVVMGKNAPWLTHIRIQANQMLRPTEVLVDVSDMAKLMVESDLAIGGAGSSAWERCCLGLPSLIIVLAENQQDIANALENAGIAILVEGYHQIPQVLDELQCSGFNNRTLSSLAQASFAVTDGFGCERVSLQMLAEYA